MVKPCISPVKSTRQCDTKCLYIQIRLCNSLLSKCQQICSRMYQVLGTIEKYIYSKCLVGRFHENILQIQRVCVCVCKYNNNNKGRFSSWKNNPYDNIEDAKLNEIKSAGDFFPFFFCSKYHVINVYTACSFINGRKAVTKFVFEKKNVVACHNDASSLISSLSNCVTIQ